MDITNQGKITLNKPLTQEAIDAISNADVRFAGKTSSEVGDSEIYVEDFCDSEFEETINMVIEAVSPLGYVLNGEVDYFGDYDGVTVIKDNKVEGYPAEAQWMYEECDKVIIEVLEKRGYTVTKKA